MSVPFTVFYLSSFQIWSDGWAAYNNGALQAAGYRHEAVNHQVEFVRADGKLCHDVSTLRTEGIEEIHVNMTCQSHNPKY